MCTALIVARTCARLDVPGQHERAERQVRYCGFVRASCAAGSAADHAMPWSAVASSGDVEGRAVIDGRANDWQPIVTFTACPNASSFTGMSPLIVAGDHDVEGTASPSRRRGVARKGDPTSMPSARRVSMARSDGVDLLAAKRSVFPCVRIHAGDSNPRRRDAEAWQFARHGLIVAVIDSRVSTRETSTSGMRTVADHAQQRPEETSSRRGRHP